MAAPVPAQGQPTQREPVPATDALEYRCIGPSRGGRVTAVAGVEQQPGTFYMGATGGGVWKTSDWGQQWRNVSDGSFASPSIGAIAVAHADPEVVWVGTGSDGLRSNVIPGRGVYKSTDGGETWRCCGLEATGHIGAVVIDPTRTDTVFVAAIGNAFAPNDERGVYRTTDGGTSWQRVLHVSNTCGAVDLELHPADPATVYASMWETVRKPWTIVSGGTQGGVWRSTDAGDGWQQLGGGLPTGVVGKSDLAVSRAEPDRLWVLIEAATKPGLYRSDDRGATFELVSSERGLLLRPFYYCNVDCDPSDADHLFVSATGYHESADGGRTWRRRSTPHGDNHGVWIDPTNPRVMIQCNDGGANVTIDGGRTWSTQNNQSTAEIYQVAVDDRFPYWVYGGQQDNSTIRVPSRSPGSAAAGDPGYWEVVGGCETGPVVPKPGDPDIVYANCKGRFGVYDHRLRQERQYYVGAANLYGHDPKDLAYRFQRVAPITVSPHDPNVVYHGSQFVHRTDDGGVHWQRISPDLTANEPGKQVVSGEPITRDITGEEYYSTLYEIAESPVRAGVIWAGSNDGPIHVTQNGGSEWLDVTPAMPPGGRVQTIEPSWRAAGTAYACVLRYQLGDPAPWVWRTTDFGASWRRIVSGLPDDCPVRVLREDPQDPNVLYLGADHGMFVSLDAGDSWRPFQQNLPIVPVTDLVIHDDDLVLSTMGRSFWILDDVSPVRSLRALDAGAVTLLPPRPAVRTRLRGAAATVHYVLPDGVEELRLEIYALGDGEPRLVRSFAARERAERGERGGKGGDEGESEPDGGGGDGEEGEMRGPRRRGGRAGGLPAGPGLQRFRWDLRADAERGRGPLVAPGDYELRLVHAGGQSVQRLAVGLDPRLAAAGITVADLRAQSELILRLQAVQQRAGALVGRVDELEAGDLDEDRKARLAAVKARLVDQRGIEYPQPMLVAQLRYLASMLDRADQRPGQDAYGRLEELETELSRCEAEVAALE
ncbi:MAG: hypothetical protein KDE27_09980 [Planctomycetes bacterium]|nr:hypothetical protein [Planctomycetota bacterium]